MCFSSSFPMHTLAPARPLADPKPQTPTSSKCITSLQSTYTIIGRRPTDLQAEVGRKRRRLTCIRIAFMPVHANLIISEQLYRRTSYSLDLSRHHSLRSKSDCIQGPITDPCSTPNHDQQHHKVSFEIVQHHDVVPLHYGFAHF